jgi:hypothetical protein
MSIEDSLKVGVEQFLLPVHQAFELELQVPFCYPLPNHTASLLPYPKRLTFCSKPGKKKQLIFGIYRVLK